MLVKKDLEDAAAERSSEEDGEDDALAKDSCSLRPVSRNPKRYKAAYSRIVAASGGGRRRC